MPNQYSGKPGNVTFSSPVNIASSTNASPVVVTTTTPHGLMSGMAVEIVGHLVNTSANGRWIATVTSPTTFSIPPAGVGVGGATGTVQALAFGQTFQTPSGGDAMTASSVNVALGALGDRTARLLSMTGALQLLAANVIATDNLTLPPASWATCAPGSTNTWTAFSGSPFVIDTTTIELVDVQLDLAYALTFGVTGDQGIIGLFAATYAPGGSPSSYAYLPGSARRLVGETEFGPLSLSGQISAGPGHVAILPYGRIGTASDTMALVGTRALKYRRYGVTGAPT